MELYSKKFSLGIRSVGLTLILGSLFAVSCRREQRNFDPPPATQKAAVVMSELQPGGAGLPAATKNSTEENANALSDGKRLFSQYNCTGCHANGGGAIGPALMDEKWIYGSESEHIYASIVEGRPNGMPSFRNKISDYQVWELAAYVRSLSGQIRKDVAPGRSDGMYVHRSEQRVERKNPQQSYNPKAAEQP